MKNLFPLLKTAVIGIVVVSLGNLSCNKSHECKTENYPIYKQGILVDPYSPKREIKRTIETITESDPNWHMTNMILDIMDIKDSNLFYRFKVWNENKDSVEKFINKIQYGDTLNFEFANEQYKTCKNEVKRSINHNFLYEKNFNWYMGDLNQCKIKILKQ